MNLSKIQRRRLFECDNYTPLPVYSSSEELEPNDEIIALIHSIIDSDNRMPRVPIDIMDRQDFSPAVMNFVKSVMQGKEAIDPDIIPDELTNDDMALLKLIPHRASQGFASSSAYASRLRDFISSYNKNKSNS